MHRALLSALAFAIASSTLALHLHAADRIEIIPQPDPASPAPTTIRWITPTDTSWDSTAPTFTLSEKTVPLSAKGWLAATSEDLHLRLDVADPVHVNQQKDENIWNGDFVRVSIDGRGDAAGPFRPRAEGVFGPDDASIGLALTPTGPQAWVYRAGHAASEGAYPRDLVAISRDEAAKTTSYRLRIPWSFLHTPLGACPQFGIVVQVRDVQKPDQARAVQIRWGAGADGPIPGLFQRVAIGAPPVPVIAAGALRESLLPGQPAEIAVAVGGNTQPVEIQAKYGTTTQILRLPPDGALRPLRPLRRYSVLVTPETLPLNPAPCRVAIVCGDQTVATAANIANASLPFTALQGKLAALEASADHPLLQRTLHSARLVLEDDWRKTELADETTPGSVAETAAHAARILSSLLATPPTAAQILQGDRPLVVAFVSEADRTLQFCQIRLPRAFDPQQTYPLLVYLHGHGNGHPLNFLAEGLAPMAASSPKYPDDRCITVIPWGRGNYGYADIGETDVREAMAQARRLFRIDPDRTYLTGFSMGGGGTWALAHSMPDEWAAAAIQAGGPWFLSIGQGFSQNVRNLPIMIWHGDSDGAVPVTDGYTMQRELELFGNIPAVTIIPGRGHWVTPADSDEILHWLLQHKRQRPNQFSYVCTADRDGIWGITLGWSTEPRRQFTCTLDDNTIRISSSKVGKLAVDCGPKGLGLSGDVRVYWNTLLRYEGPADEIELPWKDIDAARE